MLMLMLLMLLLMLVLMLMRLLVLALMKHTQRPKQHFGCGIEHPVTVRRLGHLEHDMMPIVRALELGTQSPSRHPRPAFRVWAKTDCSARVWFPAKLVDKIA